MYNQMKKKMYFVTVFFVVIFMCVCVLNYEKNAIVYLTVIVVPLI